MALFAINDTKLKCNNVIFTKCQVVFRRNLTFCKTNLRVSELINPKFIKSKNSIVCYCDGVIEQEITIITVHVKEEPIVDQSTIEGTPEYYEKMLHELLGNSLYERDSIDIEEDAINVTNMNALEYYDYKESQEHTYEAEKLVWSKHHTDDIRFKMAVENEYRCDEEYCKLRATEDFPGFMVLDHTAFYWACPYPSLKALGFEKLFKININGSKKKYNTLTRVAILEEFQGKKYDEEIVLIYNYLGKFDLCALVSQLESENYVPELDSEWSEIFRN